VQLLPTGVRKQVAGVRRHRAGGDEEHVVHLVRRFGERHLVLEGIHNAFGGAQAHDLVERGMLEP
jgi:hypothetical protein